MPRARDAAATRAALLDAARRQFGELGYAGTTTRSVAAEAEVDPALVARYFGGKRQLFAEASELRLELPDLRRLPLDQVAEQLLSRFFAVWEGGGPFLPLLRSAATDPEAVEALLGVFVGQVLPALRPVVPDRPEKRAALVGSQILGLAFARYVVAAPPVARMSREEVTTWVGPVLVHYLGDPVPRRPARDRPAGPRPSTRPRPRGTRSAER